ncbi:MAG TPA: TVP38/TMEM64 family protein [Deltaproteobacteria bacterium]|nr:TVP38/TMEM64 family protein [Deltaproteobacteria bacterium]
MKKSTVRFAGLVAFIVAAAVAVRVGGGDRYLDQEVLRRWIAGFGPAGPLAYILLYSLAPVLMLPGLPITVVGGVLFGPFWGVVYVAVGANMGACLAFLAARYMGRRWVESLIEKKGGGGRLAELDRRVETEGWKIVAFTRLIPLFPFNVLNYAFGLTSIRFSHYAAASFVFMLPGITAYVVFSSSLLDVLKGRLSKEFVAGLVLVVAVSLLPFVYRRMKGRF